MFVLPPLYHQVLVSLSLQSQFLATTRFSVLMGLPVNWLLAFLFLVVLAMEV
jgi:hypothetical protein